MPTREKKTTLPTRTNKRSCLLEQMANHALKIVYRTHCNVFWNTYSEFSLHDVNIHQGYLPKIFVMCSEICTLRNFFGSKLYKQTRPSIMSSEDLIQKLIFKDRYLVWRKQHFSCPSPPINSIPPHF